MTWNPLGDIIATGSNDKSIKLLRFDPDNFVQENAETELNIHNGTVRELSFVPDKPAILVSGGAGIKISCILFDLCSPYALSHLSQLINFLIVNHQ